MFYMNPICIAIGTGVITTWIYWLFSKRKEYLLSWILEGPTAYPIVGNSFNVGHFGPSAEALNRLSKSYLSPMRLWLGTRLALVFSEPDQIEAVLKLKSNRFKDFNVDILTPLMKVDNIFTLVPFEIKLSEITYHSFQKPMLKKYQQSFEKHCRILTDILEDECHSGVVFIDKYVRKFVVDAIGETLYEEQFNFQKQKNNDIIDNYDELASAVYDRLKDYNRYPEYFFKKTKKYEEFNVLLNKHRDYFHPILDRMIKNYLSSNKKSNVNINEKDIYGGVRERSYFESLMTSLISGTILKDEIVNNYDQLFFTMMDSLTSQISSVLMLLAAEIKYKKEVVQEIDEFYKNNKDAPINIEDFSKFPLLDCCVKEVMRLFPVVTLEPRWAQEEFTLPNCKSVIPIKTALIMDYYTLHRNPKYWDNPNKFEPDRFLPERNSKRKPNTFYPVGGSENGRIAKDFIVNFIKTAAIHILRKYDVMPLYSTKNMQAKMGLGVRIKIGFFIRLKKRDIEK